MDFILLVLLDFFVLIAKIDYFLFLKNKNKFKKKFKVLLIGYNGNRNTGSDVRVEEIVKQIRAFFSEEQVDITVPTLDLSLTKNYFKGATQVEYAPIFFPFFLFKHCRSYDAIIACEGSMFKSKFTDLVTIFIGGALGLANAYHKLSIGYGGEVGAMSRRLVNFVKRNCQKSYIITRNAESVSALNHLGIKSSLGTDTAWSFIPYDKIISERFIKNRGWEGKPLLVVCPVNPFWWPVKGSVIRYLKFKLFKTDKDLIFNSIYFHQFDENRNLKYQKYISSFANAINKFVSNENYQVVVIGMEKLDQQACEDLRQRLTVQSYLFTSRDYDMYELVGILRLGSIIMSSRFHAIVTSMPVYIPSGGITMDERIANILNGRKDSNLIVRVDDPDLEEKIFQILKELDSNKLKIQSNIKNYFKEQTALLDVMANELKSRIENMMNRQKTN